MGRPGFALSRRLAQRKARAPAQPRPSFWHHLDAGLGRARSLAVSTTLLLALGLLGWAIVGEVARNPVIIEPLLVPESAAKAGYAGEALARQMRDRIREINEGAKTLRGRDDYVFEREQVDIDLPGGLVSIRTLVTVIRGVLNRPARRVTAEVIELNERESPAECDSKSGAPPRYVLVAYLSNPARSWTVCGDAVRGLARPAADGLMLVANPYVLASYHADRNPAKAQDIITKSIMGDKNADYPWALLLLGNIQFKERKFDEAIAKYKQAARLNPNLAVAYNNWGIALAALNQPEEAIVQYEKATQLDPTNAVVWWNWGNTLFDSGKSELTIDKYERATRLDPNFAWAYNNWGSALRKLDRPNDAIDKYDRATRLDPIYAHAYKNWGDVLHERKEFVEAAEKYKQAAQLQPEYADAYYGWSNALSNLDPQASIDKYEIWIELCQSAAEESCKELVTGRPPTHKTTQE